MHGTPCKYEARENLILGLAVAASIRVNAEKILFLNLGIKNTCGSGSYREKIKVGRSEIHFFLNIFFHGFGVFLLGDLQ